MIGEGVTKFYYYKGPAVILRTSCANGAVFGVAREIARVSAKQGLRCSVLLSEF